MLVRQLPPRSRTAIAQHGDKQRWGDTEHLLATVVDLLAAGNWQRGRGKGQRPRPLRRPGAGGEKRYGSALPLPDAVARLEAMRTGNGRRPTPRGRKRR